MVSYEFRDPEIEDGWKASSSGHAMYHLTACKKKQQPAMGPPNNDELRTLPEPLECGAGPPEQKALTRKPASKSKRL